MNKVNDNKKSNTKPTKKKDRNPNTRPLNEKEKIFCREYIKDGNGMRSATKAGYAAKTSAVTASKLLNKPNIRSEIDRLNQLKEKKAIMDANEVMELYSAIARGEVKDQFGLDASLNDRIKAMNEIAKRTVDIENRIKGVPDNQVVIKLDWDRK